MPDDEGWRWYWGRGGDPEVFNEAGDTREEALGEAESEYGDDERPATVTICEGRPEALSDDCFFADDVLERWDDHNAEKASEDGELHMDPDAAQKRELEEALRDAFSAWRKKHGLGRAWTLETRKVEEIELVAEGGDAQA